MNQPTAQALLSPVWLPVMTKEEKLQAWLDAKAKLDEAKDTEMTLRKSVVESFPFDANAKEGTQRLPLAGGYELKVVLKQNYNLDSSKTDDALNAYENAAGTPEEHGRRKLITERLVSWKPSLSVKEFRELDKEALKFLEPVLTITDGSPTLELVSPKVK